MCALWMSAVCSLQAADDSLASVSAPVCPAGAGVRSARSSAVQMNEVMVSVTIEVTRDQTGCSVRAALWVTQNGVSEQVDISDMPSKDVGIVDIDPDGSGVLLSFAGEDHSTKAAFVSFNDGAEKWIAPADLPCDGGYLPVGFTAESNVVFAVGPPCGAKIQVFAVNRATQTTNELADTAALTRFARAVSDSEKSCGGAPEVIGACYTARARLAVTEGGDGFVLWPVGDKHVMAVASGMVPDDLRARVGPDKRVYATMVICPVRGKRASACVESAQDFKTDLLHR
jgi:hypothetical protein